MLFNSVEFTIFLPIVFILYWFLSNKKIKVQNFILLVASYLFYGWWDWRFLSLIMFSSLTDFFVGLGISKAKTKRLRKLFLLTSIFVNIGLLAFFKYFNFFIENFAKAFLLMGHPIEAYRLHIILPIGISFYSFQTLSYSIDIYRKKLEPTKDIIAFFAFVSFFPQLVAGPIERATNLLPQFYKKRTFDYHKATDGMRQILWGLFKKIVIADSCAKYVNEIFYNYETYSGSTLLLGAIFFAFQIYSDFSGYSDIAIGTSRLFGFNLMQNFAFPYFSRDVAEFWRRWHISLSSWFRDYVYIPLGGSKAGIKTSIRNVFIIFLLSGFWHGANWTFIVWGLINAIYFLPLMLMKLNRKNRDIVGKGKIFPTFKELIQIGITFFLTLIAWIFFRSSSISQALNYIGGIFSKDLFLYPQVFPKKILLLITILVLTEWLQREKQHALQFQTDFFIKNRFVRWSLYMAMISAIFLFGGGQQEFIYFQF